MNAFSSTLHSIRCVQQKRFYYTSFADASPLVFLQFKQAFSHQVDRVNLWKQTDYVSGLRGSKWTT